MSSRMPGRQTFFVRHTKDLSVDHATREMLWECRYAAIHFPDNRDGSRPKRDNQSLDPSDCDRFGARAVACLVDLASEGGYVCTTHFPFHEVMVGAVEPDTRIELLEGVWSREQYPKGRVAILKAVRLRNVRILKPAECAVLLVGRPRRGTIAHWPAARGQVADLVERRRPELSLDSLSPAQHEIMCAEYLRHGRDARQGIPRLERLLLPIGGTMQDIDVCAIASDGRNLFAQVTFRPLAECSSKLAALERYAGKSSRLVMFCDAPRYESLGAVTIVPIREVFDSLQKTEVGKRWLARSLSLKPRRDV